VAERVWTVKDALDWMVGYLTDKGDEQPRLSAEWLLSAATGLSRVEVYAYHDRPLADDERDRLREGVRRRADGMPLQYVTGEMPFRHIVVRVEPGVFIPRPETETLVQVGLDHLARAEATSPVVADVCTGSGCVAISVATEFNGCTVWASDRNEVAARVAADNAERLGVGDAVKVAVGDLFEPFPAHLRGLLQAVLANPPYIPSADVPRLPEEIAGFEPELALDGGPDGLEVARRIMRQAADWLAPGGLLAMELDERCVAGAVNEMKAWYEEVYIAKDLAGRDRVAAGVLP